MFERISKELTSRWRALFEGDDRRAELQDEVRLHLELETEDLIRQGVDPQEARRRAAAEFGAVPKVLEECREEWGLSWFEDTVRDLRLGLRSLLRAPRFSAAAVLSLGLGLGATLLVYALVEAVVLRPLPLGESDRLVRLWELTPEGTRFSTSDLNVLDFREQAELLDDIAVISFPSPTLLLRLDQVERRVEGTPVSGNFFRVLGVDMLHGRSWTDEETAPGTQNRTVVVSHAMWRSLFGDAIFENQEIDLGGERWQVVGVTPPGFRFGAPADLWLPYALNLERPRRDHRLAGVARLADGATIDAAHDEIAAITAQIAATHPDAMEGYSAELEPIRDWAIGPSATRTSYALAASVALLLALACISVSGLLMARAAARRDEMSLRRALGAGRGRLVRQLLAESGWISLGGLALGWTIAVLSLPWVRAAAGEALPRADEMALSPVALAVAVAAMLMTTFGFGLLPAWRASSSGSARSRRGLSHDHRLRSALVVGQMALALVLVAACLTLVTSFQRLNAVDPGFDVEGLRTAAITLPTDRYTERADVGEFYRRLLDGLAARPEIESVGASTLRPFVQYDMHNTVGQPDWQEQSAFIPVRWRTIMPGTLRTMGLPLLAGRDFREQEGEWAAIVSAKLAEQLYGTVDVIGRPVRWLDPRGQVATIIGVTVDARDVDPTQPAQPTFYWSQGQVGWPDMSLHLRSDLDHASLQTVVSRAVHEIDPNLPPVEIASSEDDLANAVSSSRLSTTVFTIFAAFAFLVAVVGLYGLIAFSAANRRAEIGLRIALGSRPGAIGSLFVRQALALVAGGALLGFGVLLLAARPLSALLFETSSLEPVVLLATAGLFAVAAICASLAPALRVARRNPVQHLHQA